jgi:hypothetical protein
MGRHVCWRVQLGPPSDALGRYGAEILLRMVASCVRMLLQPKRVSCRLPLAIGVFPGVQCQRWQRYCREGDIMSEQLLVSDEVAGKLQVSSSTLRLLSVRFAICLSKYANPPKNRPGHDGKRLCRFEQVTIMARAQGAQDRAIRGFRDDRPEISQFGRVCDFGQVVVSTSGRSRQERN